MKIKHYPLLSLAVLLTSSALAFQPPGADGLANFHLLAGFSGHGLMHAPGCGRAMAELLVHGRYETIDLSRLGWQRIRDGKPLPEQGII